MWRKYKYYYLAAFFIIAILLIENNKYVHLNWYESYSKYDNIPYGNKLLYDELLSIYPKGVSASSDNIEQSLQHNVSVGNYLFINNSFTPGEVEIKELLNFISEGNQVLIVSRWFDQKLLDTLALEVKHTISTDLLDSLEMNLQKTGQTFYHKFTRSLMNYSFTSDIHESYTPLGFISDTLINFLQIPFGKGQLFLHVTPLVFTNYHMLNNDNHRYISAVLSHLPDEATLWDEYYKNRKNAVQKSQLHVIVGTDGLRQAIYLLVLSILVYMLFAAKRKQRVIPVKRLKSNDTVNFVKTIGQLYYNENNNQNIGLKRINFFMSFIRKYYQIYTEKFDQDFCRDLHKASGVSYDEIKKLATNFNIIKGVQEVTDEKLIEQDKLIEAFYKTTNYNG